MAKFIQRIRALPQQISHQARKPSLRVVFTVPVLMQLVLTVGLVGYLSFRNGQKAVQDLALQLRSEISARIQRELQGYFGDPHAINRLNATVFRNGDLAIETGRSGEHLLFQQMKIYPTIAFVYCGSAKSGEFFGVLRSPETGDLQLAVGNKGNGFQFEYYSLNVRGLRQLRLSQASKKYDARLRPWYQAAINKEGPAWTDVYIAFTTKLPNVTASVPVYDNQDRQLLGVCATDVVLPEEFRTFLKALEIGKTGQAFVVDRNGHLISSSTDEPLMQIEGDRANFLEAINSQNPLVQESMAYLQRRFDSLNNIQQPQQLTFKLNGRQQYLEVLPFNDGFGLDWLIVVVVPESDFMGQIHNNTRITVLLCGVALAIALAICVFATRSITRPILRLNTAVREIAEGNWDQHLAIDRGDEVGQLAQSVNKMAQDLKDSFERLERQRNAFARFFPPEYLVFLKKDSVVEVALGDYISREMTVMFSDIRNFTSMAERMEPREVFNFINAYFQRISPEIRNHGGFVAKFIGDGMMAVFPERVEDGIDSAIAQLAQVRAHNDQHQETGWPQIEVGIALHMGHLMVGMIGEESRIQGDAISDTVNLAARLEGLTKLYGVALLVSESVVKRLKNPQSYQLRFLDRAIVKGRREAIAIYEVLDGEASNQRALKCQTLAIFERAIQAYGRGDFDAAKADFSQVLKINPLDHPAQLYLERLAQFAAQGTPENWDGTWYFTQKR